ncbi:MAG: hypothetical protein KDD61_02040 [Bdellovibrionales bacterium]|nr:hypothetical protein [Bdellovibrionales bacterium]
MRRIVTLFILIFLSKPALWASSGSEEHSRDLPEEQKETIFIKMPMDRFDRDTRIPKELVGEIEKHYIKHFRVVHAESSLEDNEVRRQIPRRYLNVIVEFEKNGSYAIDQNIRLQTVQGSGVVDFKKYVSRGVGHFKLRVKVDREGADSHLSSSDVRVYFVGETRAKRIDGKIFGSGCNTWMEVSKWFRKTWSREGLDLYAKEERYLRVVGGTYYFVHFFEGVLYLSTLTFKDSRYPDSECPVSKT